MRIFLTFAFLFLPHFFTGCSIFPWGDDSELLPDADSGPVSINWKLIGENPATYLPEGIDPAGPTDAFHGSWIVDHDTGARYFIPKGGTDGATATQITNDALSRSSRPSAVGEVIDKTKDLGSSAVGKVSTGIDKITPSFGKKGEPEGESLLPP